MNKLSELFMSARDGDTVTLEKGHIYHVSPEDSFTLTGYHCSNSADYDENPDGKRITALYLKGKKK